jgi:predicted ABC-type transport system involved in lysophospholipase L1 biosynthesis ATPase subunit
MSVVYEVTAVVAHELAEEWERYMRERHIPDVLATGWFTRASLARASGGRYRICYHAESTADLDRYLSESAPALRAEVAARYPGGVALTRETWDLAQEWGPGRSAG